MKKFKIKVLEHLLKNDKIAKSGDIVAEGQLLSAAEDLVKKKFIEPVDSDVKSTEKTEAEKAAAFKKGYEAGDLNEDQLNGMTKKEIGEYAEKHGYIHDTADKKEELIIQALKAEKDA